MFHHRKQNLPGSVALRIFRLSWPNFWLVFFFSSAAPQTLLDQTFYFSPGPCSLSVVQDSTVVQVCLDRSGYSRLTVWNGALFCVWIFAHCLAYLDVLNSWCHQVTELYLKRWFSTWSDVYNFAQYVKSPMIVMEDAFYLLRKPDRRGYNFSRAWTWNDRLGHYKRLGRLSAAPRPLTGKC